MPSIVIRLGGYQKPASIHTRACLRFGEALKAALGERVDFQFVPDVLALGHKSGDLPRIVKPARFAPCPASTAATGCCSG